jgi:hypothetical protein
MRDSGKPLPFLPGQNIQSISSATFFAIQYMPHTSSFDDLMQVL